MSSTSSPFVVRLFYNCRIPVSTAQTPRVCPRNDLAVARTWPNGSSHGDSGPNRENVDQPSFKRHTTRLLRLPSGGVGHGPGVRVERVSWAVGNSAGRVAWRIEVLAVHRDGLRQFRRQQCLGHRRRSGLAGTRPTGSARRRAQLHPPRPVGHDSVLVGPRWGRLSAHDPVSERIMHERRPADLPTEWGPGSDPPATGRAGTGVRSATIENWSADALGLPAVWGAGGAGVVGGGQQRVHGAVGRAGGVSGAGDGAVPPVWR